MAEHHGFQRQKGGWLEATPDPKKKALRRISAENKELKAQLAELAAKVADLTNKKGKK